MKKILIPILIVFLTFIIYKANDNNLIDYMSLGDSFNQGINSYGNQSFGYNDYIKSYLENNNLLHKYNAYYTKNGYTIKELTEDIINDKEILYNDKNYNIKKELREADLVTLAIGMDELITIINNDYNGDIKSIQTKLDEMILNMDNLIKKVTSLSKSKIILLGYYNPYINSQDFKVKEVFAYLSQKYMEIANKYSITYVDIYNVINQDKSYLPNASDYHLTSRGYLKVATEVIKKIDNI